MAADAYRAAVPVRPPDHQRLLEAIRGVPRPRRARKRPSPLAFSPLAAAAGAIVVLAAGILIGTTLRGPARMRRPGVPTTEESARLVRFALVAPGASRVAVVGDFNGWDPAARPRK